MKPLIICVLGMHRSGTSCLTGTLEEAGVYLGDVVRQARYNAKGNRENPRIMALHDDLLAASGGSWDAPPESVQWTARHRAAQSAILDSYATKPVWGFKDPRTLFTLDGWLDAIPRLTLIGTFRHPDAVARSLQHRNQFDLAKGYDLWAKYNRKLLQYHARRPFPLLSFDQPQAVWGRQVSQVLGKLGLEASASQLRFFDPALRHQQASTEASLPSEVRSLYWALCDVATVASSAA
ncbi:MAG: sulfotransferase [Planctomycetia bacterium]|nr:sulfotransferase [Planctomycetia bacterium]